jgi:glycerate kinase
MDVLASAAKPIVGYDMSTTPGAGASGGLGAGLLILGATLRPRVAAIDDYFHLQKVLDCSWDIVFTAEGALDSQSTKGKMTGEVARRAKARGAHVIALAGTISKGANSVYDDGFSAFTSILDSPLSLVEAMQQASELLTRAAERTMRVVQVGLALSARNSDYGVPAKVLSPFYMQPQATINMLVQEDVDRNKHIKELKFARMRQSCMGRTTSAV